MSYVKSLYLKSRELYDHLVKGLPKNDEERDQYIEKIEILLTERESQINQALQNKLDLNDTENKIGTEINKLNQEINRILEEMKNQIGKDLKDIKIKKEKGQKYENPYSMGVDAYFFDKKGV